MNQFTKALNEKGFGSIELPQEGISPLQVVAGSLHDGFEIIGELQDALEDGFKLKCEIKKDLDFIQLNNVSMGTYEAKAGTKLLSGFFKQMSNLGINLDAYIKGADGLEVRFDNCKKDSISQEKLTSCLSNAKVRKDSRLKKLSDNGKRIFIITEILKSNSLKIEASSKKEGGAKIEANGIKDLADASGQMDISSGQSNKMSATGGKYLTFGFKLIPISLLQDKAINLEISDKDDGRPATFGGEPEFVESEEYTLKIDSKPEPLATENPIELKFA